MTNNNYNIYIVEDQGVTRTSLRAVLENAGYCVSGDATTAEKAWLELQNKPTDLVLIDFGLKGAKNGSWLAEKINESLKIPFIYLTAYGSKDFLEKIMKTNPAGYIMKPYNKPTLLSNIEIAIKTQLQKNIKSKNNSEVFLKTKSGVIKFTPENVCYLMSNKNYVTINTANAKFYIRDKLENVLMQLDFSELYRVHRRFAVNINFITKIDAEKVIIAKKTIPLSKSYDAENLVSQCMSKLK